MSRDEQPPRADAPQPDPPTPRPADWDTAVLHAAWRAGEPGALEALCRRYWGPLAGLVRRHPLFPEVQRRGHEPEDIAQDVCVEFITCGQEGFVHRGEGSLLAWLKLVLHRTMVGLYRRGLAEKHGGGALTLPLEPEHHARARPLPGRPRDATPTSLARHRERLELASALLSDEEHFAWSLIDLQGHTSVEVARMVGRSDAAVRGSLFRARQKLGALFGPEPRPPGPGAAPADPPAGPA